MVDDIKKLSAQFGRLLLLALALTSLLNVCNGCGIITHIEISHRAKAFFKDDFGSAVDYAELIRTHNDALMAGSPYPDSYYSNLCASGNYHDVSEDTHWAPFLNATVNYINDKYPKPWDEATEKLVVFTFGIVSHQVADILWHNLGLPQGQGFLQSMANENFYGEFNDAHPVGDFGGDILTDYALDTSYIPIEEGWYIPVDDLFQIYINYYNGDYQKMPQNIIKDCSLTLFLARLAEALASRELFKDYAQKSPFLVDQFEKFFIGGVDDMAGWTNRIWQQTITMIENGTDVCDIPKSTLFLSCNSSLPKLDGYRNPGKNGYFRQPSLNGVSYDDVIVTKELRGIRIKPSPAYVKKLKNKQNKSTTLKFESKMKVQSKGVKEPDHVLYVQNENARLGESYATGDLNFDGKPDLVVTAPGYGTPGSPQEGRVYIIYGDDSGIPPVDIDLNTLESKGQGQILKGWGTAQSRFGTSVAVMDINLDGADDIAIGAPAYVGLSDSPLKYNGYVLVYFGIPEKGIVANGAANITIVCQKVEYCNLGYSMTSGDIDNDSHPDLIMGTPFARTGAEQQGFVTGLYASKLNTGYQYMDVGELKWGMSGDQTDGWFGYDIQYGRWGDNNALFVSQPEYRICHFKNCTHSIFDTQAIGRLVTYYGTYLTTNWTIQGVPDLGQLGWSADIGYPYPNTSKQVIAISAPGAFVEGSIYGKSKGFIQTGRVFLYNTTNGKIPTEKPVILEGDREFERFGSRVQFWDVNNDGVDDMFVTAPLRSDDFTEEIYGADQGLVYMFAGGENFSSFPSCGNSIITPCPSVQATYVLQWMDREPKVKFGTNLAFLKSKNANQLFVTAQHDSNYARLSGAIGVFNFP